MRTAYGREQMTRRSASRTARPRGGSPDGAVRPPDHGGRCGAIGSRPAPGRRRAGDGPLVTPSPAVSVSTAAPYGRVCRAHTPATAVVRRCPPATNSSGSRGRPGGRGTAGTAGRRCRGRSASGWPTARTAPRPTAGPEPGPLSDRVLNGSLPSSPRRVGPDATMAASSRSSPQLRVCIRVRHRGPRTPPASLGVAPVGRGGYGRRRREPTSGRPPRRGYSAGRTVASTPSAGRSVGVMRRSSRASSGTSTSKSRTSRASTSVAPDSAKPRPMQACGPVEKGK